MKRFFSVLLLFLAAAFFAAGENGGAAGEAAGSLSAEERARISYAFGMAIGFNLLDADMVFDYEAFVLGMRVALENAPSSLSPAEAVQVVDAAFLAAMYRILERSRLSELDFLAQNMERPEVNVTASGLQFEVLRPGVGDSPGEGSVVRVHYEGFLLDGTLFDSSLIDGESVIFNLSAVIPGWSEGLRLMSEGARYRLYVPSALAYGRGGIPQLIPPYSTLVFYVELLEVVSW